jgi:hypothetical protein
MSSHESDSRRWLVVDAEDMGGVAGVHVEADTKAEAAQRGYLELLEDVNYDEPPRLVAVYPVEARTLYLQQFRTERAELQCCGGWPDHHPDQHPELDGQHRHVPDARGGGVGVTPKQV